MALISPAMIRENKRMRHKCIYLTAAYHLKDIGEDFEAKIMEAIADNPGLLEQLKDAFRKRWRMQK